MIFTANQWAILALVLVLGWILGLLSRSGGGRGRRAYEEERDRHAALRTQHDAHVAAAAQDRARALNGGRETVAAIVARHATGEDA